MSIAIDTIGIHPATECCFEALQWLHERRTFANALDMGCGNGILACAAASIWDAKVIAVDISEQAIADTKKNIAAHQLEHHVTPLRSDGFFEQMIHAKAPYDLILFNLLAEQHVEMAPYVKSHLQNGGVCIASGILAWKAEAVDIVYRQLGFTPLHTIDHLPWRAYILEYNK